MSLGVILQSVVCFAKGSSVYLPSFGPKQNLDPFLLDFRIFLLEVIREAESDDGQSFHVILHMLSALHRRG